jgi:transposase InsO family protein
MIVDFINHWTDERTGLRPLQLVDWLRLSRSKYYHWREHYGQDTARTQPVPRDHWLEDWEWDAIVAFAQANPLEGYRRLTFMMLDADRVAVSPSTTYRVLLEAGLIGRSKLKASAKGKGFTQPLRPHEHWHIDVSYLNIAGTFYYLCSILDGYSRAIVHWEVRETMKETDVEIIVQRALEKHPGVHPRIISDNGPQFIAGDFKSFIRELGLTHVRTSPYYPQSNGKLERYHRSIKADCIRPQTPLNLEDARRVIGKWVEHYNTVRLHSAIGYIAPADKLAGKETAIFAARDTKLEAARERRKQARINRQNSLTAQPAFSN